MNRAEKILFSVVVISLLIVGSFIFEIHKSPPVKSQKGITERNALSKSMVQDRAKQWIPDAVLVHVSAGFFYRTNITNTGLSREWDFLYCYNITTKSEKGKIFRVNDIGEIFNESPEIGWTTHSALTEWKLDSNKATKTLFHSSRPKNHFGEDDRLWVCTMTLDQYSNDDSTWEISVVELYSDFSYDFMVDANTGELLNGAGP